jgi:hypothetical protein
MYCNTKGALANSIYEGQAKFQWLEIVQNYDEAVKTVQTMHAVYMVLVHSTVLSYFISLSSILLLAIIKL